MRGCEVCHEPVTSSRAKFCSASCRARAHRQVGVVVDMPRRPPDDGSDPVLTQSVDAALAEMSWIEPADMAVADLARALARLIDTADDQLAAVSKIGPQLLATLRALGGTPGDRKALGVEAKVKGKLAQLREGRGRAG